MSFEKLKMRFFGTPLLISADKASVISAIIADKFDGKVFAALNDGKKPIRERQIIGSTAIIEAKGTLVKQSSFLDAMSGLTSYQQIKSDIVEALEDESVENILLAIDSPGGEASGCADLAEFIYLSSLTKPVYAHADGLCCSAAYWIGSACRSLTVTQDAIVGSIGVVMALYDRLEANQKAGVKVHVFHAGAAKADGSPDTPFTDESNARIQTHIDALYALFVDSVAQNRQISQQQVIDTQAQVYLGKDAIDRGLADKIGTIDSVLGILKGGNMPKETAKTTPLAATEEPVVTCEDTLEGVKAVYPVAAEAAMESGIMLERARMTKIDELTIKGHSALATQAKGEGWDIGRFLEAQTVAAQAVTEQQINDLRAEHLAALRADAAEDDIIPVPATTPETTEEITELDKKATPEQIEAAYKSIGAEASDFATLAIFSAGVRANGWKKED